jgi:hypothetical protein
LDARLGAGVQGRWEIFGLTTEDRVLAGLILYLTEGVLSTNGSTMVGAVERIRGLGGPRDPTLDLPTGPQGASPRSIYLANLSGGLANNLEDTGSRVLVNVCTGFGASRTLLPAVLSSGELGDQPYLPAVPGRDSRLTSEQGATLQIGRIMLSGFADGA